MTMPPGRGGGLPPIDFLGLNDALLRSAEIYLARWLPGGRKDGREWVCASLSGGEGRSCSVNMVTGRWSDFATGDSGGDLVSLFAAVEGISNGKAAVRLMDELGLRRVPMQAPAPLQPPAPASPAPPADEGKRKTLWRPVVPVPDFAPKPTFRHFSREASDLVGCWEYRFAGQLYGYVVRFQTSDGGKDVLPHTWCVDGSDGNGTQRWHWLQWAAPRPLYVPATLLAADPALVPVVLVEGEKCAKAGFDLLPAEYDWVTWPGGSKAWDKADWAWLKGRVVVLWPDCDAKRVPLTKAEREAGVDEATKPLLPEHKQPGLQAMVGIAGRLAELGCSLLMVKLPKPGDVKDGWDVADAIEGGWGPEQVRAFLRAATVFTPLDAAADGAAADGISTPSMAGAAPGADAPGAPGKPKREPYWRDFLLWGKTGPLAVRENLVAALEGVRDAGGAWYPGVAAMRDVLAFNEFTNDVVKLRGAPWGGSAGLWGEAEELDMGEWLVRQHNLPSCARGTLEEAVAMVARRHAYHPVRAYLERLQWDGTPRLSWWLRHCCMAGDQWDEKSPLMQYLARVGTWFLQGMVARVMEPGVKFDYMLILEGRQGLRKSTLLKTLAGDWFADTGIVLGDKDSYQQLQGRWLYEFAELDSFGKAEVTKIKSFIASASDYFRASFDRRARDYPRQVVFGGTTNEDHYLTDPTGNRRFWPVRVTQVIDIEWLVANRDQLMAEAVMRWREGRRMYPTTEEETKLFAPQQQLREVENAISTAIATYLESETGLLVSEVTLVGMLGKIGIGVEKLGPGRYHEKQAAAALRNLGWTEGPRSAASVPGRPRKWQRPASQDVYGFGQAADGNNRAPQAHDDSEAPDGCPF
jgi:predicted P-loop ATPase